MRRLWSEDAASFHGDLVNFDAAKRFPKPVRGGKLPIIFGGESGPALKRTADIGNGWFGFNVGPDDAAPLVGKLRAMLKANGREAGEGEIIAWPYTKKIKSDDLKKYSAAGGGEVVILWRPPGGGGGSWGWVRGVARGGVGAGGGSG